ncbi:hypothetical protein N1851_033782 [Merluccius polli]|uniref:Endonuclease/exonuclease/phosphatase domain-containing protein n=1 Tax=Merluccius polli TaxID=89951 RepID=A0AA47NP77_MERPO|nr:hypothetical protein N1851_033782 [Merluccius polli]
MRGFDLGVFAALWTLFSRFACGQHVGGGEAITYSRELLLALRPLAVSDNILHIPRSLRISSLQAAASGILSKKHRRKRGRRGGVQRRLRKYGLRDRRRLPALPTILLSNVQSIRNKMDELEAHSRCKRDFRETCLLAFTETWLGDADPNEDLHITGFGYPVRMDRSPLITNKSRGGGVCFYINERYCNTVVVREKICTPDLELLSISIRPFYLPREFPQLFFTLVYINPRANVASVNQLIAEVTNRLDALSPDAPKFILGDFNHCQVQKTLKTYEQYVTCATTKKNSTIDLCYGSVPGAFRSLSIPPFGASYHNTRLRCDVKKTCFDGRDCKMEEERESKGRRDRPEKTTESIKFGIIL